MIQWFGYRLTWTRNKRKTAREVKTQSMVTYRRDLNNPRFQPLPDMSSGAEVTGQDDAVMIKAGNT